MIYFITVDGENIKARFVGGDEPAGAVEITEAGFNLIEQKGGLCRYRNNGVEVDTTAATQSFKNKVSGQAEKILDILNSPRAMLELAFAVKSLASLVDVSTLSLAEKQRLQRVNTFINEADAVLTKLKQVEADIDVNGKSAADNIQWPTVTKPT